MLPNNQFWYCYSCGVELTDQEQRDAPRSDGGRCGACKSLSKDATPFEVNIPVLRVLGQLNVDINDMLDMLGGLTLDDFREKARKETK